MKIRNRDRRVRQRSGHRCGMERFEPRYLLATITVTSAADNGPGTLRQAITDANNMPGADRIEFAIGSGPVTIAPTTPLPEVNDPLVIDGTTQPGGSGTPLVELNGSGIADLADGLVLNAGQSTVRSLVINRFSGDGIRINGDGNRILGNRIGTDHSGTAAFGNGGDGVSIQGGRNNQIGGAGAGEGNLISGNGWDGIAIFTTGLAGNNAILGNRIGTDPTGSSALPNGSSGVALDSSGNQVGGTSTGQGNTIAYNGGEGVRVGRFFSNVNSDVIRGNSIFDNGALGIDLNGDGVTPNDPNDFDSGSNQLQNFPTIDAAYPASGGLAVEGRLRSRPAGSYSVDLYSNDTPDPSGFGEGRRYLGTTLVSTDADGFASFSFTVPASVPTGQYLTATATDALGNTSEFSRATLVTETARADLGISVTTITATPRVGEPLVIVATVTNNGPAMANGVTLTDALPAGLDFIAVESSQGSAAFNAGTVAASLGSLLPDQSATVTIRARPTAAGTLSDQLHATADEADPMPANNRATLVVDVQPPVAANLLLGTYATPSTPTVGKQFQFTAVVLNQGPATQAENVVLTLQLPAGVDLVGIAPSQGSAERSGQTVTVRLGTISNSANATVDYSLVASDPGDLNLVASVRSDRPDPDATDNQTTVLVPVQPVPLPDAGVSISAFPSQARAGEPIAYTVAVTSNGPGAAEGTVLVNDLPAGATIVGSPSISEGTFTVADGRITAQLGTLDPGRQVLLSYTLRATGTGVLTNTATVSTARPDQNPGNNRAVSTVVVSPAEPADLAVGIVPVPQVVRVGDPLRYTIIAVNYGPGTSTGTVVRMPLPQGVEVASTRPSQGDATVGSDNVLVANFGQLATGGQALVELTVIPRAVGPLEATATIEGAGPDFQPTNNQTVSLASAVASKSAPLVVGSQPVVSSRSINAIVLSFNLPLDPALAGLPSNYALRLAGTDGRARGGSLPIRSATYDDLSRTVTLVPARPLAIGSYYLLQANAPGGPGLVSADGIPLDGDYNGLADGIYEELIGRGTSARPTRVQLGPISRSVRSPLPPPAPSVPNAPARLFAAVARRALMAGRAGG